MAKLFDLTITTPEKTIYEGRISSLIARSKLGYLGVLADHAPIIAALADGKITATDDSGKTNIFDSKGGGFLEVVKNKAVILLFAH